MWAMPCKYMSWGIWVQEDPEFEGFVLLDGAHVYFTAIKTCRQGIIIVKCTSQSPAI